MRRGEGASTVVAFLIVLALLAVVLTIMIAAKKKGTEQGSQFVDCTKYIGTVGGGVGSCAEQIDCSDVKEARKAEYRKWTYIGGWGCEKAISPKNNPAPYCCAGSEKVTPQEAAQTP